MLQPFVFYMTEKGVKAEPSRRCLDAATRYLAYRPRSESELKSRLTRRGFDAETVQATLAKLRENGLLDDAGFARFWQENRSTFRPRSQRLVRLELQEKGVDRKVIDESLANTSDDDTAFRLASQRASRMRGVDYPDFARRVGAYLRRRGFDHDVVHHTIEQVWKDLNSVER